MDGYKIIDFKGIEIKTDGVTVPGVYNAIDESNKPLIASNINLGGAIMKPFAMGFIQLGTGEYSFAITSVNGVGNISISEDDTVTLITE